MANGESEYLQVGEAAARLKVSDTTIREWFDSKRLDGFLMPGSGYRRITRESVERLHAEMHGGRE